VTLPSLGHVATTESITLPGDDQFLLVAELVPGNKEYDMVYSRRKIGMTYYHPIPDPPYIEVAE